MGTSPEERFKRAAKSTIDLALEDQEKTYQELVAQQGGYLGGKAPQTLAQATKEISKASGQTFPKFVKTADKRFFDTAEGLIEQGRSDLRGFRPDLLGSDSVSELSKYLQAAGQQFAGGVQQMGEAGRDRLFALPEQAQRAFTASSQNPAFENLANAQYMNFSKNPPTVQSDAFDSRYWTYNV